MDIPIFYRHSHMTDSDDTKKVIVVDLQMPFLSMVVLMVKWALASIPAIIILFTIFSITTGIMGGMMFHGS
ncbi:MAG: hypothetical protein PHW13_04155 [Methylococcales bacterium]|nr:hypothetical protein [Methylococcales bacterium]